MLRYVRKNKEENLREFGLNLISYNPVHLFEKPSVYAEV
jgi:hypothetical protein